MSRYTKQAVDKVIVYGHDHALGYFYEEWLANDFNRKDDDARPFTDRCQMFGMKRDELVERLQQYRCRKSHIEAVENGRSF